MFVMTLTEAEFANYGLHGGIHACNIN
jgi:hypothetical protein